MRAAAWFVALGVLSVVLWFALTPGIPRAIAGLAIVSAATIAVLVGILWHRPGTSAAWWALFAGMVIGVVGNAVRVGGLLVGDPAAVEVVNEGIFLTSRLALLFAAVLFIAARRPREDREGLFDALMVLMGAILLVLAAPPGPPESDDLLSAVTATLTIAILVMVIRLFATSGRAPLSLVALLAAITLHATGSLLGALQELNPLATGTRAFFLLAAVSVGAAALHPSMREVTEPQPIRERRPTPARMVALGAALLINPIVALRASYSNETSPLLFIGVAVLTVLVLWRIGRLVQQRERFQAALVNSEVRLQALVQHAFDAIMVLDVDGTIRYASPALARMLHRTDDSFSRVDAHDLISASDGPALRTALQTIRNGGGPTRLEVRLRREDGTTMWGDLSLVNRLEDPAVGGIVVNLRDTTTRKRAEAELQHLAMHDPLTGLPNRAALLRTLEDALRYDTRRFDGLAVLFVDLEGFKSVNDRFGHTAGDRLLAGVADRLQSAIRPYDTVARYGGDEFVVIATGIESDAKALVLAERLRAHLRPPFNWPGVQARVGCTIGVARTDHSETSAEDLIAAADQAMYRARRAGQPTAIEWVALGEEAEHIQPVPARPPISSGPPEPTNAGQV